MKQETTPPLANEPTINPVNRVLHFFTKPLKYWFVYSVLLKMGFFPGNHVRRLLLPFFLGSCGKRLWVYPTVFFHHPHKLHVGNYVNFNSFVHINADGGVYVGDYSGFGPHACVMSSLHNHPENMKFREAGETPLPVRIGSDCLVGAHAVIMPGTILGDGCIVAPGSIVRGTFPESSIIAGNPARAIRKRTGHPSELPKEEIN